jgi:hypothetical protein
MPIGLLLKKKVSEDCGKVGGVLENNYCRHKIFDQKRFVMKLNY